MKPHRWSHAAVVWAVAIVAVLSLAALLLHGVLDAADIAQAVSGLAGSPFAGGVR